MAAPQSRFQRARFWATAVFFFSYLGIQAVWPSKLWWGEPPHIFAWSMYSDLGDPNFDVTLTYRDGRRVRLEHHAARFGEHFYSLPAKPAGAAEPIVRIPSERVDLLQFLAPQLCAKQPEVAAVEIERDRPPRGLNYSCP